MALMLLCISKRFHLIHRPVCLSCHQQMPVSDVNVAGMSEHLAGAARYRLLAGASGAWLFLRSCHQSRGGPDAEVLTAHLPCSAPFVHACQQDYRYSGETHLRKCVKIPHKEVCVTVPPRTVTPGSFPPCHAFPV